MKIAFIIFCLSLLAACGGDKVKNVYMLEYIDGKPVVKGSENGLIWYMDDPDNSYTKLIKKTYKDAKEQCEKLDYAGYTDWRLPTIDELRTLVVGYEDIEPDGRCKVGSSCLLKNCLVEGQKDGNDFPCANNDETELLTGPGPEGCFFDDVWRQYCGKYWSSSKIKGVVDEMVFQLDFSDPAILSAFSSGASITGFARCVR